MRLRRIFPQFLLAVITLLSACSRELTTGRKTAMSPRNGDSTAGLDVKRIKRLPDTLEWL